jgi:hypothetical protein
MTCLDETGTHGRVFVSGTLQIESVCKHPETMTSITTREISASDFGTLVIL